MPEILTAPITNAIKRLTSRGPDARTRLGSAMQEVQRLQGELEAIQDKINQRTDIARFTKHVAECRQRFEREQTFEAERDLILAELISAEATRRIQPFLFAKQRGYSGGDNDAFASFVRQHPTWREILKAACEARLAVAANEVAETEKQVRGEFGGEFSENALRRHPRFAKARHVAAMWRSLTDQCETERDEAELWRRVTRNLGVVGRVA
jgi:hypothetical protein